MFKKGGMTYQYPRRMGDCMDFRCVFLRQPSIMYVLLLIFLFCRE